ncbi:MAG TPA: hypothetical protein VGV91_20190 [Rubrobacter sp.]|nr:hypothetical protein [Rubrobacter sp.]
MTPTKIRIAMALVGAALTAAALTSGAAAAERVGVDSRVTLAQADPFHGKVLSRKAACERGRTVEVYRVDPGPDGLYDRTTSDAQGAWTIPASMPNGKFYAVAKQRSIDAPGKTIVCKRATSPKVAF